MRLPELDWPINLFTDEAMSETETIEVHPTIAIAKLLSAVTKVASWKDMEELWTGNGMLAEPEWSGAMFDTDQIAA